MIYHIMNEDTNVIDIETDENNKVVRYNKFVPDSFEQPFWGDDITTERLFVFLKGRCFEDSRRDLPSILAKYDMTVNNPYEWCRKTHGVNYDDFFWIKYDDEDLTWKDVSVREAIRKMQGDQG